MPKATKRERQRQNRDARRVAMMEAEKRKKRLRTARNLGFLLIPIVIIFVVIQVTNGSDSSSSSSSGPTNFQTTCDTSSPTKATTTKLPKPGMGIDTSKQYTAVLHTTEGDVTIALDAKQAPQTVNNFVYLSCKGYYNGSDFYRIVTDFVDQAGAPKGDNNGGPGYTLKNEPPKNGYSAGSVAMARGSSGISGSQFFLVVSDNGAKQLAGPPYQYSDLGTMDAAGLAVAQQINTFGSASTAGTPTKAVTINGVTITDGSASTTTTPTTTTPGTTTPGTTTTTGP